MEKISKESFLLRQPSFPKVSATDPYYYELANRLMEVAEKRRLLPGWPEAVVQRAALCVIGYYQDTIIDAGLWHSFIDECRRRYGRWLPFFEVADDYIPYELNREDVRFVVWYALAMNYENRRMLYPLDKEVMAAADAWHELLDSVYDDAPTPEDYNLAIALDLHEKTDHKAIYDYGYWLFMHSWLMAPAFALSMAELLKGIDLNDESQVGEINKRVEQAFMEDPTGPLAYYVVEWLSLIIDRKPLPEQKPQESGNAAPHPYYEGFIKATEGEILKFFDRYDDLNDFFIKALGWDPAQRHLQQLEGSDDFVVMINREKGMLVAHDVARCIKAPINPYYDEAFAREHAIELFTVRGVCPADLLTYCASKGWIPDAAFPGTDDRRLVADNWDFIARCYLQQYYRGD